MKTVEVSQSALESLQKMVEQLQGERDELLEALEDMLNAESSYPYGGMSESEIAAMQKARLIIAKCTAEQKVMA